MLRELRAIVRKALKQAKRDPRFVAPALIAPLMLLSVYVIVMPSFGGGEAWACGLVVEDQTTYGTEMAEIIRNMKSTTDTYWFTITEYDSASAEALFESGAIIAYILIPDGFGANISVGVIAEVALFVSNLNDDIIKNYVHRVEAAVLLYNQEAFAPEFDQSNAVVSLEQNLTLPKTPGMIEYAAAATIVFSLFVCAVSGQALSTTTEFESRAIYETLGSPLSRFVLILGLTIAAVPRSLLSLLFVIPIICIGLGVYPVGNLLVLSLIALLTILALVPIGELIGIFAKRRETALLASVLISVFAFLVGGGLAPIGLMPLHFRIISLALPTTHAIALWTRVFFYDTLSGLTTGIVALIATWVLGTAATVFVTKREVERT